MIPSPVGITRKGKIMIESELFNILLMITMIDDLKAL